ncbi:RNA 2',3'-cyclic phosphodiesterase [Calidithermus roseus]|uniref:RNA 2',3'-cyclic phosphodiesterase n=1 Tax=Calidithermus roseus TaxID=1644118 RepID=A0A399EZ00_9DEIN|nr:RNA 2',3'-cyclic phosphodiesterase [Calidithermus roseus]
MKTSHQSQDVAPRPETLRLFYAIFVPRNLRPLLEEAQRKLKGYRNWKPTPPEQLHLTLMFLGEVATERLDEVTKAGEAVARQVAPFTLRIGGTGYFPPDGTPRVWFVKAEGAGLEPLAVRLRAALPDLDDAKPFKAHITLARRKGPAPRVGPVVLDQAFEVRKISLVRSELSPKGSLYHVLREFELKGREA